jgi:two-component system, NarL family, invasion response regulator UvrY
MPRRILVVDDHVAVRRGLTSLFADEFQQATVETAATSAEALQKTHDGHWDLIILDLNMPGRGGLELIHELKDRSPSSRILIYTVHPDDQLGVRALRAGADGYVSKDRPAEDLVQAIRTVARGHRYISPELAESLANYVVDPGGEPHETLSDREFQILRLLASGKTPTSIGEELHLSIKTVSTYRTRILEKLDLQTTAELIRYAIEKKLA